MTARGVWPRWRAERSRGSRRDCLNAAAARRPGLDRDEVPGERPGTALRDGEWLGSGHQAIFGQRAGAGAAPERGLSPGKIRPRHRLALAAGAGVLLAVLLGLGVSTWAFFQERRARARAEAAEQDQSRSRALAEQARQKARAPRPPPRRNASWRRNNGSRPSRANCSPAGRFTRRT